MTFVKFSYHMSTKMTKPYSVWMAESVMSHGGGIASNDGDTGQWLRVGFFQIAVFQLMVEKPFYTQQTWLAYLKKGTDSVVNELLDATRNTQYSMDRLSIGPGLFYQYITSSRHLCAES